MKSQFYILAAALISLPSLSKAQEIPTTWQSHILFFANFDEIPALLNDFWPESDIETGGNAPDGLNGGTSRTTKLPSNGYLLKTPGSRSLEEPLTVSFWWKLDQPLAENEETNLIMLDLNGQTDQPAFLTTSFRGGPWFGLEDTAGVTQVVGLKYSEPLTEIYDRQIRNTLALDGQQTQWHNTALVITAPDTVQTYMDGAMVSQITIKDTQFSPEDTIKSLVFGRDHILTIDDVLILDSAATEEEIGQYFSSVKK